MTSAPASESEREAVAVRSDTVVVGSDLVEVFRRASRDENPLHVDPEYARGTVFGEPVVYGVLAALVAIGGIAPRAGRVATRIALRFPGPVLVDRPQQRVVVVDEPDRAEVRLVHGATRTVEVAVDFGAGSVVRTVPADTRVQVRATARDADLDELREGDQVPSGYQPRWDSLAGLVERLGLAERGLGPTAAAVLAWASYLAGMEAPGRASLLADITAEYGSAGEENGSTPFTTRAVIDWVVPRYRLLSLTGSVRAAQATAEVKVRVFHRPSADRPDVASLRALLPCAPDALAGRTALVVGASRGLGAAISQALALAGADVYAGFHRSSAEAAAMRDALGPDAARVRLVAGDAADPAWCRSVRQQLEADGRRLDLLVLSACPPPAKVPLVEGSVEVAATYLTRALDLVRTPLTVLAEPVARAAGRVVAISSRWATAPEPGWFPYVAAKAATEGLLRAAAAEYPDAGWAVIRPGRLRTAFNATPMATEGVERVEPVAARLVGRLAEPLTPGVLHVLD